jgi:hypothetical protein
MQWERGDDGFVKESRLTLRQAQGERKKRNELNAHTARAEPVEARLMALGRFFHRLDGTFGMDQVGA